MSVNTPGPKKKSAENSVEEESSDTGERSQSLEQRLRQSMEVYYNDMGYEADGRQSRARRLADSASNFLFSRQYTVFCIVMVLLNMALLIWEVTVLAKGEGIVNSWVFKLLEIFVNVSLAAEIALRAISQQKEYCTYWGNILDCVVLVASVTALILILTGPSVFNNVEEGIAFILVSFRYLIAFLRVVTLVKNQTKAFQTQRVSEIGPIAFAKAGAAAQPTQPKNSTTLLAPASSPNVPLSITPGSHNLVLLDSSSSSSVGEDDSLSMT